MGIFRNEDDDGRGPEDEQTASEGTGVIPLLPLRDIVVFPHMVVPLFVGRAKSIRALEEAMGGDRELMPRNFRFSFVGTPKRRLCPCEVCRRA